MAVDLSRKINASSEKVPNSLLMSLQYKVNETCLVKGFLMRRQPFQGKEWYKGF